MKKITNTLFAVLVLSVGLVYLTPKVSAQQTKDANAPDYRLVSMALDLADYGYDNQSVMALTQAAEILIDNPVKSASCKDSETNKTVVVPGVRDYSPATLLAEAKRIAGKDEVALACIAKVEKNMSASVTRGTSKATAVYEDLYLYGGETKSYYEDIPDLSNVMIWTSESSAHLCLYVYNTLGQLKDSDCATNPSTDSYFAFEQRITFKVSNNSSYGTSFRIWFQGYYL